MKELNEVVMGIIMNESGIVCLCELVCDIGFDKEFLVGKGIIYVLRDEKDNWIKELEEMKVSYCEDMEYEVLG